jgi:hypothetical protein
MNTAQKLNAMAKKITEDTNSKTKKYIKYWTSEILTQCKKEAKDGKFNTKIFLRKDLQSFWLTPIYISNEAAQKAVLKIKENLENDGFVFVEIKDGFMIPCIFEYMARFKISW